jgi:triacylglycerol esterase/lipase EstA (alpha/beta hydrolase family)
MHEIDILCSASPKVAPSGQKSNWLWIDKYDMDSGPYKRINAKIDIPVYQSASGLNEGNAMVCIEVINRINGWLAESGSKHEIVLVGPSMGGQITRYALAYMENPSNHNTNTYNGKHNCRLWVSFAAPHQGANISMGAQAQNNRKQKKQ